MRQLDRANTKSKLQESQNFGYDEVNCLANELRRKKTK
jgi:hypothetical protein